MSNASTWWAAKETEVNSYSVEDWDSASHWNNEEKSLSFHSSFHEELEWFTHHFHNVNDDKIKSSQDCFAETKILNVFKEVSW